MGLGDEEPTKQRDLSGFQVVQSKGRGRGRGFFSADKNKGGVGYQAAQNRGMEYHHKGQAKSGINQQTDQFIGRRNTKPDQNGSGSGFSVDKNGKDFQMTQSQGRKEFQAKKGRGYPEVAQNRGWERGHISHSNGKGGNQVVQNVSEVDFQVTQNEREQWTSVENKEVLQDTQDAMDGWTTVENKEVLHATEKENDGWTSVGKKGGSRGILNSEDEWTSAEKKGGFRGNQNVNNEWNSMGKKGGFRDNQNASAGWTSVGNKGGFRDNQNASESWTSVKNKGFRSGNLAKGTNWNKNKRNYNKNGSEEDPKKYDNDVFRSEKVYNKYESPHEEPLLPDGEVDWPTLNARAVEFDRQLYASFPNVVKVTYKEAKEVAELTKFQADSIRLAKNDITVTSLDDTDFPKVMNPVTKFSQVFDPYPEIMKKINEQGFKEPSPIQSQLWPILMSGRDCIGIAQTGTGKTLAYLLPALLHIEAQPFYKDPNRNGRPLVLILAPTRELAQQIQAESAKFLYKGMRSVCVYGQGNYDDQSEILQNGVEIIVATPGRLYDFIKKGITCLRGVSYLVVDEADRMLDMGFLPDIIKVTMKIRKDRQTVFTSATWQFDVEYIVKKLTVDLLKVRVGELDLTAVSTVTQIIEICEEDDKFAKVTNILLQLLPNDKVIIFANRKATVDYLTVILLESNLDSRIMHGGLEQGDREESLEHLKTGVCNILIATDVASRGLDVRDLTKVINFDLPKNLEEYVHRAGRTGRAGKTGQVISFVTWDNRNQVQDLIGILERSKQMVPYQLRHLAERAKKFKANKVRKPKNREPLWNVEGYDPNVLKQWT